MNIFYMAPSPNQAVETIGGLIINYLLDKGLTIDNNVILVRSATDAQSLFDYNLATRIRENPEFPPNIILTHNAFLTNDVRIACWWKLRTFIVEKDLMTHPRLLVLVEKLDVNIAKLRQEILTRDENILLAQNPSFVGYPGYVGTPMVSAYKTGHEHGLQAGLSGVPMIPVEEKNTTTTELLEI